MVARSAVERDMRALLLAAGKGTRLRPLTDAVPKCLVPIHGRPLLAYWLDLLFSAGIERVLINTYWLAEQVRGFVANSPWRSRIDLIHETELLGTGGTVLANRGYFGDQPFMVAHADNLSDFDASAFMAAHRARPPDCAMTMLAFRSDDPSSCGILERDDRGVVRGFHEKVADPPGNLANGAVYIFEPEVMARIAAHGPGFIDLSLDIIPAFLDRIMVFETSGYHRDIGNAQSLHRAHFEFKASPSRAG
jgi:mannose-1-phosphate guanylyltransferase